MVRHRRQRRQWSKGNEKALITEWQERTEQLKSEIIPRKEVYIEIAKKLKLLNMDVEWCEVKSKMESLQRKFNRELQKNTLEEWVHYPKMLKLIKSLEEEIPDTDLDGSPCAIIKDACKDNISKYLVENDDDLLSIGYDSSVCEDPEPKKACIEKISQMNKRNNQTSNQFRSKQRPCEEGRFIDVWQRHFKALELGKQDVRFYRQMEKEIHKWGIKLNTEQINGKIESLKRKYFLLRSDELASNKWRNFDKVEEIIQSVKPALVSSNVSVHGLFTDEEPSSSSNGRLGLASKQSLANVTVPKSKNITIENEEKICINLNDIRYSRKQWTYREEVLFLEIWKKNLGTMKMNKIAACKKMRAELDTKGIYTVWPKIKGKIESFIRKYKCERDTVGSASNWVHYQKMAEILEEAVVKNEYEAFQDEGSTCFNSYSEFADELEKTNYTKADSRKITAKMDDLTQKDSIFSDDETEIFIEAETENSLNTSVLDRQVAKEVLIGESLKSSVFFDEQLNNVTTNKGTTGSKPILLKRTSMNAAIHPSYGDLIVNELQTLDLDLLVETKRKIYNVICQSQGMQLERNKRKQIM